MLTKKQLTTLAKYPNRDARYREYNEAMTAASRRAALSWAKKLAKKHPASSFRFRLWDERDDDSAWQSFGDDGQLALSFLEATKKQAR